MAVDKSLYAAPLGIEEGAEAEASLEIEIVDPEMVTLDDGSVEVTIIPGADIGDTVPFDANLADVLEENALNKLSSDLMGAVDADISSRKDWADTFVRGLDVLGFKYEERTEPWEGACGVYSTSRTHV